MSLILVSYGGWWTIYLAVDLYLRALPSILKRSTSYLLIKLPWFEPTTSDAPPPTFSRVWPGTSFRSFSPLMTSWTQFDDCRQSDSDVCAEADRRRHRGFHRRAVQSLAVRRSLSGGLQRGVYHSGHEETGTWRCRHQFLSADFKPANIVKAPGTSRRPPTDELPCRPLTFYRRYNLDSAKDTRLKPLFCGCCRTTCMV